MALNLSSLFHTSVSDTKTWAARENTGSGENSSSGYQVQSGRLAPGQTISGEVVERDGDQIQIRVGKDAVIHARMEQEIQTVPGQNVMFQVRSNASGAISLRPLFENLSQENTALKALAQAGVEVNEKSMQMLSAMMEEGMPVGKDAVREMYGQVMEMPGADVSALVQMKRLQIPVTPENLEQFMAYRNYEHQLTQSFAQVAEEIPQAVAELFAAGGSGEGAALIGRLLDIFQGMEGMENLAQNMTEVSEDQAQLEQITLTESSAPAGERAGEATAAAESAGKDGVQPQGAEKTIVIVEEGDMPPAPGTDGAGKAEAKGGRAQVPVADLPRQEREQEGNLRPEGLREEGAQFARLLREAGAGPADVSRFLQGEMDEESLYRMVRTLAKQADTPQAQDAVKNLFLSQGFQKIFQGKLSDQWMLSPPQGIEKREVAKLYERLNDQTRQLTQALSEAVRGDSPLLKSVQNIRENVDFMNQLNQMYTYVQLPLKLRGENAHGDLYVYTNKKNLAKKDGSVSAFLHLDMEHLGAVDVYVAMQRGKINTNFYLADDESLSLLEKNMDLLTERLTQKGYKVETKLMMREEPGNVMEEILKTDKNIGMISAQSFDVRA